ncbi:hypothetical protein BCR42DRAFT_406674 [Absidia repens]|uniref:Uncharacterized protein n=1 Tax=Absidia repens TaxID=90262 RepID=A0A1X2IV41_9FUNG|nr:hypothetical protein BCR42DRAFT_406674 [Absidia repens]
MLSSYPCCYTSLSLTVRCMTYCTVYLDETDLGCSKDTLTSMRLKSYLSFLTRGLYR